MELSLAATSATVTSIITPAAGEIQRSSAGVTRVQVTSAGFRWDQSASAEFSSVQSAAGTSVPFQLTGQTERCVHHPDKVGAPSTDGSLPADA